MIEIFASTDGGFRTDVTVSFANTIMDEPVDVGGTGAGPTPKELYAASLAGCTAITLKLYAGRKSWPLEDVKVKVTLEEATKETPLRIHQVVTLIGDQLDDAMRERLGQISGRCPVHRFMEGPVEITEELAD